jgi:hypothetical protein
MIALDRLHVVVGLTAENTQEDFDFGCVVFAIARLLSESLCNVRPALECSNFTIVWYSLVVGVAITSDGRIVVRQGVRIILAIGAVHVSPSQDAGHVVVKLSRGVI